MIKQCIYFRIAILTTVSILGALSLSVLTNTKTATRTQPDSTKISVCTEINIELYIRQAKDGSSSAFDRLVACDSKAIPYLIKALGDKDKDSIAALGEIGANAESVLPDLTKLLGKSDRDIRVIALDAFLKISDNPVSFLIDSLKDENKDIRNGSAYALGEIGAKAESAIPALIAALRKEEKSIRNTAFHAVIKIAIENKSLVPILITALKDRDEYVRRSAPK